MIVGYKGQLGTSLLKTSPSNIDITTLDLPEFDITDPVAVLKRVDSEKPDCIINASAYTAVDRAEDEQDIAKAVNAIGPKNLALAAKKNGSRLIHVSTDYVFDGTGCTPYLPESPCRPLGVYGQTKHEGEMNVLETVTDALIIRTSWLYSQYGNNFVLTMLRLMAARDLIKVVADQVGSPTWASTLAMAIWKAFEKEGLKGIYHWSDAGITSWYDFAVAIQEEAIQSGILNRTPYIQPITTAEFPTKTTRPAYSALGCWQTWKDFEIQPIHWRVALRQMLTEKLTI